MYMNIHHSKCFCVKIKTQNIGLNHERNVKINTEQIFNLKTKNAFHYYLEYLSFMI